MTALCSPAELLSEELPDSVEIGICLPGSKLGFRIFTLLPFCLAVLTLPESFCRNAYVQVPALESHRVGSVVSFFHVGKGLPIPTASRCVKVGSLGYLFTLCPSQC